jgi:hypothetical protein
VIVNLSGIVKILGVIPLFVWAGFLIFYGIFISRTDPIFSTTVMLPAVLCSLPMLVSLSILIYALGRTLEYAREAYFSLQDQREQIKRLEKRLEDTRQRTIKIEQNQLPIPPSD